MIAVTVLTYANGLTARIDYDTLGPFCDAGQLDRGRVLLRLRWGRQSRLRGTNGRTYMQRLHKSGQPADVYQYDDLYQLTGVWYGADATDPQSISSYAYR